ncbi:MAG: WecB/TagA/CpsF family glycosyltransferase [Candidatus Eremiobacteraeota bacterium]|nr:WecB/TagA/CpsF family glycosyltransferase [Candidatus Eremiobacteraeota bacterium]
MDAAVARICGFIQAGQPAAVVTLGAEMAMHALADPQYKAAINAANLVVPDTIGIIVASRMLGQPLPERVPGIELIERLCACCAAQGWPVYFLGAAKTVAAKAAAALVGRHPNLRVAGTHEGYFASARSAEIAAEIARTNPKLVLVALGFPRQEFWTRDNLPSLGPVTCIGVGGSFDVLAGRLSRAPALWRRAGLEWLYRLAREPRRLRRQLALPRFLACVALQSARRRPTQPLL